MCELKPILNDSFINFKDDLSDMYDLIGLFRSAKKFKNLLVHFLFLFLFFRGICVHIEKPGAT